MTDEQREAYQKLSEDERWAQRYLITADPEDPQWAAAGRVHDWRNHVSEELRTIWGTFTPEQRRVLAMDAEDRAGNENWK